MRILDQLIVHSLPLVPKAIVEKLSKPYIAGAELDAAIKCTRKLNQKGYRVSIDVLGEFVESIEQVTESVNAYLTLLEAITAEQLDAGISIKPTSFGLLLDETHCLNVLSKIMDKAQQQGTFLRIDMEDSPCTDKTIQLYQTLREKYGKQVGVVLQAYMRRTLNDIQTITKGGPSNFRICKGIYVEPKEVAFKGYQEVRDNYVAALDSMFKAGAYVGIATHDDYLVEQAYKLIEKYGLNKDQYEFQMLLGVRERLRDSIRAKGHNVRIYVPFGKDWYGYSIRRLKENPALAGMFFKAMFIKR
ncbi:MAG: proline dehydrogenase [Acidobacteria bacterium]|nr:MAG: proline dehydrogenase [Acidobacteriota bacterium]